MVCTRKTSHSLRSKGVQLKESEAHLAVETLARTARHLSAYGTQG